MKTTSVALGSYFDDFIKSKIAQGFMELKAAIEEGIGSGEAVGFDTQEHLKTLKTQRQNG